MRIASLLVALSAATISVAVPAAAQARRAARPAVEVDATQLRAAAEAAAGRAAAAYNRGDMTGFIQAYAPDIWVFPPNAQPFQGPAAALSFFAEGYNAGGRNLELTTTGMERSGALAYESGTYTIDLPRPGSTTPRRDYGKYVHIWKRGADGAWRIHLATWNSNVPIAEMMR